MRRNQAAGNVSIPFSGKVGKRKLRPGTYTATFIVTDAAGNVSKAVVARVQDRPQATSLRECG